jgi:hypothetical protein
MFCLHDQKQFEKGNGNERHLQWFSDCTRPTIEEMIKRYPVMLEMSPATVSEHLAGLAKALGVRKDEHYEPWVLLTQVYEGLVYHCNENVMPMKGAISVVHTLRICHAHEGGNLYCSHIDSENNKCLRRHPPWSPQAISSCPSWLGQHPETITRKVSLIDTLLSQQLQVSWAQTEPDLTRGRMQEEDCTADVQLLEVSSRNSLSSAATLFLSFPGLLSVSSEKVQWRGVLEGRALIPRWFESRPPHSRQQQGLLSWETNLSWIVKRAWDTKHTL